MVARFDPNDIRLDWKELQDNVGVLLKQVGKGVASTYFYWVNPGLFWAAGSVSIPMAHMMRETTSKVMDVWKEHKGWTFSLICLSSFLSLPSTIFAMTFIIGSHTGSELSIEATAMKATKVYQKTIGKELTVGQQDAFFQFLCKDRNLLDFDSFYNHIQNIKQIKNGDENETQKLLNEECLKVLAEAKQAAAKDLINMKAHMIYPNVVNHIIGKLANDVLKPLEKND